MTKKKPVKDRIKEKAAAVKAKLKGAKPAAAKCCILAALSLAIVGCMDTAPASRATTANYRIDVTVKMDEGAKCGTVNMPFTLGDGAFASADSAGSTETQTATPTQDIKPDTNIDIPINKSGGGAQTVGSVLGDAAASAVKGMFSKSGTDNANAASTQKTENCADGSCTTGNCTDGNCTDGNCTTGNCTDCTIK